jgi:group I intron endonuclease
MTYVTYAHFKPDGSIFYVGKGSIRRAYSNKGRNIVWQRTVKKHGDFSVKIIKHFEEEQDAFNHEIELIECLKDFNYPLVNIANGGFGSGGFRHTEEHKKKMSIFMKQKNPMDNTNIRKKQKHALIIAMQRDEVKKKQSESRIGMKLSKSHIESLRNCHPMRACIINGKEYKSLMMASRVLGIRHGTIHRWINNPKIKRENKYSYITECRWA